MSTRRKLGVALLVLLTLGMVYLTYIEWLVAGIGAAMDFGEPTGPLNGHGPFLLGVVLSVALLGATVYAAARGRGSRTLRLPNR